MIAQRLGLMSARLSTSQRSGRGAFHMRALLLLVVVLVSLALPARADNVANAQSVIRAQEEAFRRDDAAAAYSYAAPSIRQMFPQAHVFMSMVQRAYPPVYRHKSFEFGAAQT